jgi:tetratricopeptide (TPR) repeat protein
MKLFICSLLTLLFTISISFAQNDRLEEAKKFIEKREFELAKPILEFLYEQDEENPEVNYLLGEISLRQNNYDDAIDYLDVAIEVDKNNYLYYNMLGNAYGMKAQNSGAFKAAFAAPKAKSNWEKAVELNPEFLNSKLALFQYYIHAPGIMGGDDDKALQVANDLVKRNSALGHVHLANYYLLAEENPEKAEIELQHTLTADTTDTLYENIKNGNLDILNNLGYHYLRNENYPKSRSLFSKAVELESNRPNPHDSMGDYYVAIAKYDSALICYENALKQNPKFTSSKLNKGKMLEKLNRPQEAILVYKELIEESPNSSRAEEAEDRLDELE